MILASISSHFEASLSTLAVRSPKLIPTGYKSKHPPQIIIILDDFRELLFVCFVVWGVDFETTLCSPGWPGTHFFRPGSP